MKLDLRVYLIENDVGHSWLFNSEVEHLPSMPGFKHQLRKKEKDVKS